MSTQTPTLTEFLLARIAEDEAVAKAAARPPWQSRESYPNLKPGTPGCDEPIEWAVLCNPMRVESDDSEVGFKLVETSSADDAGAWGHVAEADEPKAKPDFDHIALHDPARVLAECDARRRIVEEYQGEVERGPAGSRPDFAARHGGILDAYRVVIRALARPYADHPDYHPEWRP